MIDNELLEIIEKYAPLNSDKKCLKSDYFFSARVSDLRKGSVFIYKNELNVLASCQNIMGMGAVQIKFEYFDVATRSKHETKFNSNEKLTVVDLKMKVVDFLYGVDDIYCFMDMESFEQIEVEAYKVSEACKSLTEGAKVAIYTVAGSIVSVDPIC